MQKVLIVTYYWPPAGGPGVQRWLYFASYLPEFGVEPVVYTPENPHYPLRDEGFTDQVPPGIRVLRKKIWEPYHLAKWLSRRKTQRISAGIINRDRPSRVERLLLWIRGNFFIPDARRFWVRPSVRFLSKVLREEGIHTLVTTGPPHSMHLIGLELKEKTGVRWVADFRDPWTSIGYHEALLPGKRANKKHRALEQKVLRQADHIITTSETTRDEFRHLTRRPIQVITNGFTGSPNRKEQPEGPFILAHIGSLLSGRNPVPLWQGLKNLLARHDGLRQDLRIELTGLVSDETQRSLRAHGLEPYVTITPYVSHGEALELQRKAQVLLLPEIDSPKTVGIIPGKLFEYLAASRPILAIGPPGWEAGRIVVECGSGAAYGYGQENEIESQLLQWYRSFRNGTLEVAGVGVSRYHRRELAKRLAEEVLWE
ncbi:glycosyltransferase family 4 protein [Robiginitalea marina]|uniref:Glycosyltransferase family 4 protein n=1 Tax=Robiginitalea marina TaxID=2954105 RepID=A0ABT1AVP2_9FLAO|nr:glycosyltransferase family 4 protein [Robiginitalea marina]MCO5723635.1 glycosyltransferase family 4 protein [Robiginitalea marina]